MTPTNPTQPTDPHSEPRREGGRPPRAWATWAMVAAIAAIAVLPIAIGAGDGLDEPFAGADGQGQQAVEDIDPGYEPWFTPIIEVPSTETESGLFALQAAIGSGIVCYYFGVVRTRARMRAEAEGGQPAADTGDADATGGSAASGGDRDGSLPGHG
ncbi:hypothetical protein GCM10009799_18690 [Nocardiopsis rhodophaea]|uniref:Cobalt transport protein CbiN n=1 Tax=Nocardiopsis rhodophaea TaxID=280238 RepID=A0ABP5E7R3_9ACTN